MDIKTQERYAKAMQRFINEVENKIENKVEDWLNNNPYWEFDDEVRPGGVGDLEVCLAVSGEEVEHKDCSNFFEFVINEIYGFPMGNRNPYREQPVEEPERAVLPLTPQEKAIADINKGTAAFINELCGVKND